MCLFYRFAWLANVLCAYCIDLTEIQYMLSWQADEEMDDQVLWQQQKQEMERQKKLSALAAGNCQHYATNTGLGID